MKHPLRWLWLAAAAFALGACGATRSNERASVAGGLGVQDVLARPAAQTQAESEPAADSAGTERETAFAPAPPEAQARLRVYTGTARLAVDSIDTARDEIVEIAETAGGYVETLDDATITVRVPAPGFREQFARILALGKVVDRRIETYDVTEEYQDIAGRLAVARDTRERMYTLLEATRKIDERLAILKEIRRLTEQIEQLALSLETVERLVAWSRITVALESRIQQESLTQRRIPFEWIARLDPVLPSTGRLRAPLRPELGDAFAVFAREKTYRAESSDGVRVRIGTVENKPRGDTAFWADALAWNLGPLYLTAVPFALGDVEGVELTSRGPTPYTYLVAVAARGARLHVVEVYYPGPEALAQRGETVRSVLAALEVP